MSEGESARVTGNLSQPRLDKTAKTAREDSFELVNNSFCTKYTVVGDEDAANRSKEGLRMVRNAATMHSFEQCRNMQQKVPRQ